MIAVARVRVACTITGASEFGTTWVSAILDFFTPSEVAAST